MSTLRPDVTLESLNERSHEYLPGYLGVEVTSIELKANFLGTVREGGIACVATGQHLGRNTQVRDAVVTDEATGRKIALFRCTQMILWPKS